MTPDFTWSIRTGKNIDGSAVLDILSSVLPKYGLAIDPETTDRDLSDISASYLEQNGWFGVAVVDEVVVGSVGIANLTEYRCELRKLYVLERYQRCGIGTDLLRQALRMALTLGYCEVLVETNSCLKVAERLYRKFGFEPTYVQNLPSRCDMAMIKCLNESSREM
jgi:GNAT superfamily N-acetyltransferase